MTLILDSVLDKPQLGLVGGQTMWILSNFPPFHFSSFLSFDYYRLCFVLVVFDPLGRGRVRYGSVDDVVLVGFSHSEARISNA